MQPDIKASFDRLKKYCEAEEFMGWDPYDGLTSSIFQSIPVLRNNKYARLIWIQLFKKSPYNLRPLFKVPKNYNAKGLGLFLTGYCNLYKLDPQKEYSEKIEFLGSKILSLQNKDYSGSCWGYYFDWQARAFFQPANTPTVVATSFVSDALINAYEITKNEKFLSAAISSSNFVLNDLNRTYDKDGDFAFSYSPLDQTQVFNASLLGARLISRVYSFTKDKNLKTEAFKAVRFVCKHQQENGSWSYGTLPFHNWIDNFHTGFNLECIYEYGKYTSDQSFTGFLEKGFDYYINTFFCEDGASKYYNNQLFPVDIHSPAQLIVTLNKLGNKEHYKPLADKVLQWTITNMQDQNGFFYYQKRKNGISRIPYMRWAQSWMFYALTNYFIFTNNFRFNEKPDSSFRHTSF